MTDARPEAVFVVGPEDTGKTTLIHEELPDHVHVYVKWSPDPGPVLAAAEQLFQDALARGESLAVESVSERDLYRRIVAAIDAGHRIRIVRTGAARG